MFLVYLILSFAVVLWWLLTPSTRHCACLPPQLKDSTISGKGIFATMVYQPGDQIDVCQTITASWSDLQGKGKLEDYVFQSINSDEEVLVPLGNCGLYNHSNQNNAYYEVNRDGTIHVYALHYIPVGKEVTVNYGPEYWKSRNITPV